MVIVHEYEYEYKDKNLTEGGIVEKFRFTE